MRVTYEAPAHVPPEGAPLITSQYEPSGSEVVNVAVQSESALLIATNPSAPACETRARTSGQQLAIALLWRVHPDTATHRGQTQSAATAETPSW